MPLKIILTKGLPASGKTTWAFEYANSNQNIVNICKDDIRLLGPEFKNEKRVLAKQEELTKEALRSNKSVIWSDTNLNPIHETRAKTIAQEFNAEVEVMTFEASLKECIRRDNARSNGVGESVIKKMYRQYILSKIPIVQNKSLPTATIFDIDGTLAIMGKRSPYDWSKVGVDTLNESVARMLLILHSTGDKIVICSGRDESCRQTTIDWLNKYSIPYNELYMRQTDDNRKDSVIKLELLNQITQKYNVVSVFDDRDQVVDMWRASGITCFQVNYGDF